MPLLGFTFDPSRVVKRCAASNPGLSSGAIHVEPFQGSDRCVRSSTTLKGSNMNSPGSQSGEKRSEHGHDPGGVERELPRIAIRGKAGRATAIYVHVQRAGEAELARAVSGWNPQDRRRPRGIAKLVFHRTCPAYAGACPALRGPARPHFEMCPNRSLPREGGWGVS